MPIIVSEPSQMVSKGHRGLFPATEHGNRYILVMTELLTRWVDTVAVPSAFTETTIKALEKQLIVPHGCPEKTLSDNGAFFTSQQMQMLCYKYGIKHVFSSPYHPETNDKNDYFKQNFIPFEPQSSTITKWKKQQWELGTTPGTEQLHTRVLNTFCLSAR
ncbi:hypothetical protein AYI68_g5829 [Smittium mucronatum]|uniref:Integrase catalytic domain-containing protein n=1 Tax=Smittium mucronatum TaxID=133383 RepID=A0A1R0GT66_9FUNG|nr:hypothetical protein AYI68_g5829 [Smittium mucronatum]